jgi:hypothetical protein
MGARQNSIQLSGFSCKLFVLRLIGTFKDSKQLNFRTWPKKSKKSCHPVRQLADIG